MLVFQKRNRTCALCRGITHLFFEVFIFYRLDLTDRVLVGYVDLINVLLLTVGGPFHHVNHDHDVD